MTGSIRSRRTGVVSAVYCSVAVVVLACAPDDGRESDDTTPAPDSAAVRDSSAGTRDTTTAVEPIGGFPRDSGTVGIVHVARGDIAPPILRAVRTATHDGFDRVVFELDGSQIPGYHVEYIDRPVRQCGSGNTVQVAGDAWLSVRLEPANAHEGDTTVVATVRERDRMLTLPNLRQLVLTCDFEAQVEWVLGVRSPNRYRVLELSDPARLVVDVRHD